MPSKPSSLRMRTWGTRFDTLPTSPEASPPAPEHSLQDAAHTDKVGQPVSEPGLKRKEERMPHDASVFVGSLPSNVDQQELTRLLSEHLSEHTEVKNIKVVRDSKGGVCAFVQCEDAASAASLIYTLHSNPSKQFLGRTLRYEPARAFRTLLISYRIPTQQIPINATEGEFPQFKSQTVELPLPSAMRVCRPKNTKFYSLLYNDEAVDAELYRNDLGVISDKPSLFLRPLPFDSQTIRTIAAYFGCLETFNPVQPRNPAADLELESAVESWKLYPAPHDAPRSSRMDIGCWEVKWEHRDDCVSALMSLRRVPHLTVTWAHQPPPFGIEQRSPYSPFFQSNVAHYPLHIQNPSASMQLRAASSTGSFDLSRKSVDVSEGTSQSIITSEDGIADGDVDDGDHTVAYTQISPRLSPANVPPVRWSDMDFPPLTHVAGSLKTGPGVWSERKEPIIRRGRSASLTFPHQNKGMGHALDEFKADMEGKDHGQELEMPSTPSLGRSPLTPKTPGSAFPITPTTADSSMPSLPFNGSDEKEGSCYSELTSSERNIDPTTLFVGGLETFGPGAWDEEKVFKFFARFGGLESVKIVRPLNSQAAFAFVKFNNTESPARAVFEEHNRIYQGRAMRVQLRDCNPPRGSWKYNRGRSRFNQHQQGLHRRVHDQPDKAPEISDSRSCDPQDQESHDLETAASRDVPIDGAEAVEDPEPPVYTEIAISKSADTAHDDTPVTDSSRDSDASSPRPAFTSLAPSASESYREWYDDPLSTATDTSSPATAAHSSSTPLQFPTTGGYFAPAPWVHPYAHPIPYSMPYMGYPGYPVTNQPQISRPMGSEASLTTPNSGTWPPIGMYGSYIPYQATPIRTPTLEGTSPQQLNSRAPLAPTGFIQNEQGTLIAVYQPEALDQYMAGAHSAPQHPVTNVPGWSHYPSYPFPGPLPAAILPSRPPIPSTNVSWVPNQSLRPPQPQATAPHVPQVSHVPSTPYRSGFGDAGGSTTSASFRRQPGRREPNHPSNNHGRNNQFRSFPNRNGRGNMNNAGFQAHGDNHNNARNTPHLAQNPNDWNQRGNVVGR